MGWVSQEPRKEGKNMGWGGERRAWPSLFCIPPNICIQMSGDASLPVSWEVSPKCSRTEGRTSGDG